MSRNNLSGNAAQAYESGMAAFQRGDFDRAIVDFNQVIRMEPNSAIAYRMRGEAFQHKRDNNRSCADYEQAIRLGHPDSGSLYYKMGTKYLFGDGVDEDRNKAFSLFIKGGEKGNGNAAFALGVMFFDMLEGPNASQEIAVDAYTVWALLVLDGHTQIYTALQFIWPQYAEQLKECIQVMTTKVSLDRKYEIDNAELADFAQNKMQQRLKDMFG